MKKVFKLGLVAVIFTLQAAQAEEWREADEELPLDAWESGTMLQLKLPVEVSSSGTRILLEIPSSASDLEFARRYMKKGYKETRSLDCILSQNGTPQPDGSLPAGTRILVTDRYATPGRELRAGKYRLKLDCKTTSLTVFGDGRSLNSEGGIVKVRDLSPAFRVWLRTPSNDEPYTWEGNKIVSRTWSDLGDWTRIQSLPEIGDYVTLEQRLEFTPDHYLRPLFVEVPLENGGYLECRFEAKRSQFTWVLPKFSRLRVVDRNEANPLHWYVGLQHGKRFYRADCWLVRSGARAPDGESLRPIFSFWKAKGTRFVH